MPKNPMIRTAQPLHRRIPSVESFYRVIRTIYHPMKYRMPVEGPCCKGLSQASCFFISMKVSICCYLSEHMDRSLVIQLLDNRGDDR